MVRKRRRTTELEKVIEEKPLVNSKEEEEIDSTMNRKNFLAAIQAVLPGIAENSIIAQSDLVLLDQNKLVSYNDEIAISYPFDIKHSGGAHAKELHRLLQKLPSNNIEINEAEEKGVSQLTLNCGNVSAGFYLVKDVSIPDLGINDIDEWHDVSKDFFNGVNFALDTAATDTSKGVLMCVYAKKDFLLSCDNFRATRYDLQDSLPEGIELKIPRKAAKELSKYNLIKFAVTQSWLHFKNEQDIVFSTRIMADEYPDVFGLFEDVEGEKITLPDGLKEALSRTEILSDEHSRTKNKFIKISIKDGEVICNANQVVGWISESVKTDYKGELSEILVSPAQLSYILDRTKEAIVSEKKIVFKAKGFQHVIFLMAPLTTVEDYESEKEEAEKRLSEEKYE